MPICAGCERKVPYQELDTHQRYCRSHAESDGSSASQRLAARETMFDEYLDIVEVRHGDRKVDRGADECVLPNDLAGIEGSNIRYSRQVSEH